LLVQTAARCGEHLLAARVRDAMTGREAWRTTKNGLHTGFAHGASGIAYALLRLEAATGRLEFGAAAREALDFERDLFMPGVANWLDESMPAEHRDAAAKDLWCSWCHGAAGIGIARAGASSLLSSSDVADDLSAAVATTLAWPTESVDQLCCGNLGRVAFLSLASETRGDPALAEQARALAARVVHRAGEYGCYGAGVDPTFEPGLLQGVAGIGYELLRVTHTQTLPPLLLFA
jgi:lantibiotic modifying enzyme